MMSTTTHPHLNHPSDAGQRKARFWNRIARKYASDPVADLQGYETTLARVSDLLTPGSTVLEIGCGTGSTAMRLAHLSTRMVATDVSPAMLAIANEKLQREPIAQLRFELADADEPRQDPDRYDRVLAFNLLHLVDDLDRAISAAVHALRPGGLLITKTPCVAELNPLIWRVALPVMRLVGKAPAVLCFNESRLLAAMTRQGLIIESVERHGTRGKDIRAFIVARKPSMDHEPD